MHVGDKNQSLTGVWEYTVITVCSENLRNNEYNNNNNNNNSIYLLKLGCYPVAVVVLHVNKT